MWTAPPSGPSKAPPGGERTARLWNRPTTDRGVSRGGFGSKFHLAYERLVKEFQADIHNARFLYHYELSRYHILAQDLAAPIDHHYRYRRGKNRNHRRMGTFDRLYIAMGIHVAHIHGSDQVVLLTADDRIADIVERCRKRIPENIIRHLKLEIAEDVRLRALRPVQRMLELSA